MRIIQQTYRLTRRRLGLRWPGSHMDKKSWGVGLAIVAAALLAPLTMLQEAAPAAAAMNHQPATQRAASADPVDLKVWIYPSKDPLSPTAWECFSTTGASSPQFICGQLSVPALSGTPSGL